MKRRYSTRYVKRALFRLGGALIVTASLSNAASSQELKDVVSPRTPLVLKEQGSFIVGGEVIEQTPAQLSSTFGRPTDNGGHVTIHQMYVQYMMPLKASGTSVVMMHGATLSGKTYETTPDGRMGWNEYFVRRGHTVYVPDQVSRGWSGFDTTKYNDVRAGALPPGALPNVFRQTDEINWTTFRFGPKFGTPYADGQFPLKALDQLSAQAIPDLNGFLPTPNPTFRAMANLAIAAKGAVLMGHSESGSFPIRAALTDITGIKGLILIEPGRCRGFEASITDAEVQKLKELPILAIFGDHLDTPTGMLGFSWQDAFEDCSKFVARINAAGGRAEMLHPPSKGIPGNSHMIMQDSNNIQIADFILEWMDRVVDAKPARKRR